MAKQKSGWDSWNEKKLKKALKKMHAGYAAIIVICLLIGAAAGAFFAHNAVKTDVFELNGEKESTVKVGDVLTYTDEGVKCVSMGKDVSDKVEIRTNMTRSADGKTFTGDTAAAGEYFIEYKITEGRYAGLCRVRVFTVVPAENN